MKMRRVLSAVLALCMVLTLAPVSTAKASDSQGVEFEKLDNNTVSADLTQNVGTDDLTIQTPDIDEDELVKVIIVMDGESVVENNGVAVFGLETENQMEQLYDYQDYVVAVIEEDVLDGEELAVDYNYAWLLNGVAATVPFGKISDIKSVEGVKQVILQPVYTVCEDENSVANPNTISDGVMIGRENAWNAGYTGEGMTIAIIDTGLDVDHQNFAALSEDKLTETSADADTIMAVLENLNASKRYEGLTVDDVYYNSKVVYGFNYCDDDLDITHDNDKMGAHGTHVAGIAAANKVDGSDVVGVAPDAQLYVMKVFGKNGGAYAGDILAALEDALMLGADVVNMSLGTTCGFGTTGVEEIDQVYARVSETNTVLSVSAGNSYTAGYANNWGLDANLTENPDNAVIGEPAVYKNVLSIASVENWKIERNYILVSDGYQMVFIETSASYDIPSVFTLDGEYPIVVVPGYGAVEDFEGLDVTGKVALVQRGVESFAVKCQNAADAGAIACVVYNNTTGEFGMDLTDLKESKNKIPCVSITMADGDYLISALSEDSSLALSFPEDVATFPSEQAYRMSDFSSWGVAPDLSLEPDITAPGGNIYSTINNGEYGLMSGTSMAAPNISGMTALVLQYIRENHDVEDQRTLAQLLLTSTAAPLPYEEGVYYSPRSQGSGLANVYNAIHTNAYLTVDGMDVPKAELGDDAEKTGNYNYSFNVHNMGDKPAYYQLSTTVQTEGVLDYGIYFMSSTPLNLAGSAVQSSDDMILTHDVDKDEDTDSHDAYLIYQAAVGNAEGWEEEAFRYDVNSDEAVAAEDVQAYLNALVNNASDADLESVTLAVAAGESAVVDVEVTLSAEDKAYFEEYYPNGGYVEGFTFLTAQHEGGVDLSLPYLGFYGSWADAPVLDNGDYWDLLNSQEGEVVGNQYWHVLFSNFYGYESYVYPGMNVYFEDAPLNPAHISVSPNNDGFFDTIDDIYTSLLRNAETLTYRYSNADTDEVYYEQTVGKVSKSAFSEANGQIIPTVYAGFEEVMPLWNWKDAEGNDLTNNTNVLLEIVATGVAENDEPETWAVPIRVDLQGPELLDVQRTEDFENGKIYLTLSFRDNLAVSVVGLMNSNGNEIYTMTMPEDVEADAEGYQNHTVTYDITGLTGKLMIILSDYAMNESYYAMNLGGTGVPYGDLVAYQYNFDTDTNGWVSFNPETAEGGEMIKQVQINMEGAGGMDFVCAEYVAEHVFAQTEDGKLYGFRYEDMLADTFDIESTYITTLDNVYQDLAYSYADGKLYGLLTIQEEWYGEISTTAEVYSINLKGQYYDEEMWAEVAPYQEDWVAGRGSLYGLGLACDDNANIYILGNYIEAVYDEQTWELTGYDTSTAQLWASGVEESKWGSYRGAFELVGDTGISMDYLQSMTWDHNEETLYWARFDVDGFTLTSELYEITLGEGVNEYDEPATVLESCEKIGNLAGETCALFIPLDEDVAAKEEHANIPAIDSSVIGTPVLREDAITMNVGGTKTLIYDMDPWYTDFKTVVWSSSDESVVTVDANGMITAVDAGSATIMVANAVDQTLFDTVSVEVTALDLELEGVVSTQSAGLGNVIGVSTYAFEMVDGLSSFGTVNVITAPEELNYGLSLATSEMGRGSIWACEWGNTGMIYEIDPETGVVKDALMPMDGDMMFGLSYSESQDTFTGIMNMYMYVDLKLTHEEQEVMMGTYDEELKQYTYHRVNLLPYLQAAGQGFVTGETGNGASSEVVFCGITTLEESFVFNYEILGMDAYKDYLGNNVWSDLSYVSDQTLVLLDNVGRLWYIDEIIGLNKVEDEYGNAMYMNGDGSIMITSDWEGNFRNGMFPVEIVDESGNVTYNFFNIRKIEETPLTDMFRDGSMPRFTYHFSDIEFAGYAKTGYQDWNGNDIEAPMFAMSLYDYWNNGTTNELYLYVPGVGTGNWVMDYETWESVEEKTPSRFYNLGNTGEYNVIASIHSAAVTGGVDAEAVQPMVINPLGSSFYRGEEVTE